MSNMLDEALNRGDFRTLAPLSIHYVSGIRNVNMHQYDRGSDWWRGFAERASVRILEYTGS